MDNAQKAIMIGVGLFITIIVISAVVLIATTGKDMIDSNSNDAANVSNSLTAQKFNKYDGTVITGDKVIEAVRLYCKNDKFIISVYNGDTRSIYTSYTYKWFADDDKGPDDLEADGSLELTGISKNSNVTPVGYLTDESNEYCYVSPSSKYYADLLYCSGSVVGIKFAIK